ncbi:hypothetical protein SynRS9915_02450 [Synechococcus sp. RS9915]|nr:hypothetical protein SynRS9915_02450 [Synechococcus sp. RS9915]QNJ17902.1 hypothetical protein SynA1840_02382 [Synechococcus sp. A18-40]
MLGGNLFAPRVIDQVSAKLWGKQQKRMPRKLNAKNQNVPNGRAARVAVAAIRTLNR